jgi:hypothetical protein
VEIGGVETHGLAELLARGFGVAGFEEGIGEVFADVGAGGSEGGGVAKR